MVVLLRQPSKTSSQAPAFSRTKQDVVLRQDVPQPIPFEIEAVQLGPALSLPPVTARIAALEANTAPAYAPLESRVDHVLVKLGETVAGGSRLALLRSGDLASMLRDLRSSSALAQTKRALATRMQVLVEARGASSNDLLVARNDLRDAELQARTAESRLKSLSIEPAGDNLYWLLAGRAGVVTQIEATPGQQVGPGRDRPVATLADLDTVLVLADVPQQDAGVLHIGDPVELRILGDNDRIGSGAIDNISQVVDPDRQTIPIRIRADNRERRLRPNAFVEAHFGASASAPRTMLLVPTEAVVSDGLESVVFVQGEPGRFRRTEVTVGRQRGKLTEIRAGLKSGDRIVTRGALLLLNSLDVEG
ncbi:MAG: efflux RND transporter periplasmic adaptor subunit [Myxococcales bacterium]|nr:efflux RND transporter periplasmic adaptor subunit [Myxococcales bacterium]